MTASLSKVTKNYSHLSLLDKRKFRAKLEKLAKTRKEQILNIEETIINPLKQFRKWEFDVKHNIISLNKFIQLHEKLSKHIIEIFRSKSREILEENRQLIKEVKT
tara:strand:- start:271 stop:585 length:315 start_codon:yes stop_codon:yes gene_type:complete